jgi:GntR family transcriptional repressor for pyruvate dehydrogenase complex
MQQSNVMTKRSAVAGTARPSTRQAAVARPTPTGASSGAGSAGSEQMFTTVTLRRVSQAIVDQIRELMREGKLQPGDRLPSERELCEQFGVSRVTVREALRILESGGLITVKVGARGGAFVTTPTSGQVGAGLAELVSLSPLTAYEVTEARLVFELGIVPLVCERATDEDIADMRQMTEAHLQALKVDEYTMEMSADFHIRVAEATHNKAIQMLVQSFHGPLLMSLREAKTAAPLMGRTGCKEHLDFTNAVAARDPERAQAIMRTHLRRTAARLDDRKKR